MPATHGINIDSDQRDGRLAGEERLASETSLKAELELCLLVMRVRQCGVKGSSELVKDWTHHSLRWELWQEEQIWDSYQYLIFEMFSLTYSLVMPSIILYTQV